MFPKTMEDKLSFAQNVFLLGLLTKQFYLLPSGSFQIGDMFLIFGCFWLFVFFQKGKVRIKKWDFLILAFIALVVIVNITYNLITDSSRFSRPIIYYIYNLIIILAFSAFLRMENALTMIKYVGVILKVSLIIQLGLFISGFGRWAYATRYSGSFNDPNQYGVYIFFSILMIYLTDHILNSGKWFLWCALGTILILPSTSTGTMLGILFLWTGIYLTSVKNLKRRDKLIWGVVLIGFILLFVLFQSGSLPLPSFISSNQMFVRVIGKLSKISGGSNSNTSLLSDRGWTRIVEYPEYLLFGAGEGGFDRFGTSLEIHSSILGPLFYYGCIPFSLFIIWVFIKLRNTRYLFIYIAMFAETLFLVNTRQPLYWMLIVLAGFQPSGIVRRCNNA